MKFQELDIIYPILKALENKNYSNPTPIQEQAIPPALTGQDIFGCAQTGTGKTAAFAIPTLQRLGKSKPKDSQAKGVRKIRALVLTPTRELAMQIFESFKIYGHHTGLRSFVVFGGVSQVPQEQKIRRGIDILVATPGRLRDLMQQGIINLSDVEILTLDEADQMLDMGFIHDVRKIIAEIPKKRQTLFFSATVTKEINKLSKSILVNPVHISIEPEKPTLDAIEQAVYFVDKSSKRKLLLHLLNEMDVESALVFTRTKHGADRVMKELVRARISAQAIHGNKSQSARQRALNSFKNKSTKVLVATDVAARGIDIADLSHVINFDLPEVPETYIHRIGRTGRAGKSGISLSFCDQEERKLLRNIEKVCARIIPQVKDHPYPASVAVNAPQTGRSGTPKSNFPSNKKRGGYQKSGQGYYKRKQKAR